MPEMNLPGSLAAKESIRVNVTAAAGFASAFDETNTRPVLVEAPLHRCQVWFSKFYLDVFET
jgi:hypothetical protein